MKKLFLIFTMCLILGHASELTKEQKEKRDNLYAECKEYLTYSYLTIEDLVYDKLNKSVSAYIQEKNIKIKNITDFIDLERKFDSVYTLKDSSMDKEFKKNFEMKAIGALSITYDKYKKYRNYMRKIIPEDTYNALGKDMKRTKFYSKNLEEIRKAMYYNIFSKHLKQ